MASKDGYSISELTAEVKDSFNDTTTPNPLNNGIGKTDVHLKYHTAQDYYKLNRK